MSPCFPEKVKWRYLTHLNKTRLRRRCFIDDIPEWRSWPTIPVYAWTLVVSGRVDGVIALELEGHGGFGYDPLFFLPAHGGTFGQLPPEVKARISHRAEAIRSFCRWLTGPETKERA
jgi:hypothetical protein